MDNFVIPVDTTVIVPILVDFAINLVGAIVVLIIGRLIISAIVKTVDKRLTKKDFDATKQAFMIKLVKVLLNVLLLIIAAGILGVDTASLIALLGAAGLAVGLALQGSLSNLAGGFLIMILKPFSVGDWIEAQGVSGGVVEVNILNTKLKTGDAKIIYLPNGPLANGNITNYSEEPERRLDLTFGIGYSDDIDKAKSVLQSVMDSDPRVISDRPNMIKVAQLADSSVNFTWRGWVKTEDYWAVNFDMHEKVKKAFDAEGISIPFPQMDVHVDNA